MAHDSLQNRNKLITDRSIVISIRYLESPESYSGKTERSLCKHFRIND